VGAAGVHILYTGLLLLVLPLLLVLLVHTRMIARESKSALPTAIVKYAISTALWCSQVISAGGTTSLLHALLSATLSSALDHIGSAQLISGH